MNKHFIQIAIFLTIGFLTSCNLSKEVDINLPEYKNVPVVECYLIPGESIKLLLTNSNSYFDPFNFSDPVSYLESFIIRDAKVMIIANSDTIHLREEILLDAQSQTIYNYVSDEIVKGDPNIEYQLLIELKEGNTITSNTIIPPYVPFDSIRIEWDQSTPPKARELVYHSDDMNTRDYYRRILHVTSLDSVPEQDYLIDDASFESEKIAYGTFFDYKSSNIMINTLLHITKEYSDYRSSVDNAIQANLNPFGQPAQIKSNVTGTSNAMGIFTGFHLVRDTVVIP